MAEFDAKAGSMTPSARASPTPQPARLSPQGGSGLSPSKRSTSQATDPLQGNGQEEAAEALNDDFDVRQAIQDIREFHK